jgi:hypothetical protein
VALMFAQGGGPAFFIPLIFIAALGRKPVFDFLEMRATPVSQVDGDIWTEQIREPEGPDRFFAHIDGLMLEITEQAYGALLCGGPYRIYYLPRAKRAVGGQVLPAWRPLRQPPQPKPKKSSWRSRISIEK